MVWAPSTNHIASAAPTCSDPNALFAYFGGSGPKAFLACFTLMAMLVHFGNYIGDSMVNLITNVLDTRFLTSWGPARAINVLLGQKVLRDQSPMSFSAAYQRVLRSTQEVDVSFVSAACILFYNSSLGIAIQEIFMQAGLPWRHACVASFYLCELRKCFSRTAHKYREFFRDGAMRVAFATAASRLGGLGWRIREQFSRLNVYSSGFLGLGPVVVPPKCAWLKRWIKRYCVTPPSAAGDK